MQNRYLKREDLDQMERKERLKLINSISGIKPANLIGTKDDDGIENLAIFSSVVHLGSHPALLGMVVRPNTEVRRHTFENIQNSKLYTINQVTRNIIKKAHYTSAKFPKNVSEFEACDLSAEYLDGFDAPFVGESKLKIGMKLEDVISIPSNETLLIVGSVQHLLIDDEAFDQSGYLNLAAIDTVGISGLNSYYDLNKIEDFPYARVNVVPNFGG